MSKSSKIIIALLVVIFIAILGVGGYVIIKMNDKIGEQSNQIANLNEKTTINSSKDENSKNQNSISSNNEYYSNNTQNSTNNYNSYENNNSTNKSTTSDELVVNQEGNKVTIVSKEYVSSLGYSMRYASELFNVSYHDNSDWYERNEDINCVVVEKENVSYGKKIATLSNYEKTNVNGYEAVYITRKAEGQFEKKYYVNSGKDTTYIITTSCQDSTEYLEGIGSVMEGMVQTFSIK